MQAEKNIKGASNAQVSGRTIRKSSQIGVMTVIRSIGTDSADYAFERIYIVVNYNDRCTARALWLTLSFAGLRHSNYSKNVHQSSHIT